MARSDTWRILGTEGNVEAAMVTPTIVQITGATPVVWPSASTGVSLAVPAGRKAIMLVIEGIRTGGKETITVTESATTNGTYAAATTSGLTALMEATGIQVCTVKYNPLKPFLRVTATGDGAPADWVMSVAVLYV